MPGDPGATVVTNARVFYTTRAAAGATGTRHSPRPLFRGGVFLHNSGASRRETGEVCVRSLKLGIGNTAEGVTYSSQGRVVTLTELAGYDYHTRRYNPQANGKSLWT
jgi:hypothetical protein